MKFPPAAAVAAMLCLVRPLQAGTVVVDATNASVPVTDTSRIVSIGGAVTETIFALGGGAKVVGTDSSSVFPEAATKLPQVGYSRALSVEGVLSLRPTVILASEETGPPDALRQLRESGVTIVMIPNAAPGVPEAERKVKMIGAVLGESERAQALAVKIATAAAAIKKPATPRRVLFLYARGGATLNVAGTATAANAIIEAAGAVNAVTGYSGYRPLTAEAAVTAAPDVILIPTRGLESAGGIDALLAQPGLAQSPAGRSRRVIAMDDLELLGFGPRTGEAIVALAAQLQGPP